MVTTWSKQKDENGDTAYVTSDGRYRTGSGDATCSHCGQRVGTSKIRKMRAHKPAEAEAHGGGGTGQITPRVCSCGEPEDGGDFGWFDHADGSTYCNACGSVVS